VGALNGQTLAAQDAPKRVARGQVVFDDKNRGRSNRVASQSLDNNGTQWETPAI
jgi:hypothetical protein